MTPTARPLEPADCPTAILNANNDFASGAHSCTDPACPWNRSAASPPRPSFMREAWYRAKVTLITYAIIGILLAIVLAVTGVEIPLPHEVLP